MSTYQERFEEFFDKVWENRPPNLQDDKDKFKSKMQSINKELGQLIAKSWLHESDCEGKKIREILVGDLNETTVNRSNKIIEFFKNNYKIDISKLILGEDGKGLVETVEVTWDRFDGVIEEKSKKYYLPYPPRPTEVTDEQLKAWIVDKDSNHNFPTTPYIPLTGF